MVSGLGVGKDDFSRGFLGSQQAGSDGRLLTGFDPTTLIGKKGTRTLDRMTSLVIATAGMVLDGGLVEPQARESVGLVLGTNTGSIASIVDFTRDTFVQERPYLVNPADFPNTVMNSAAGRTAIWYGLRGLNSTIAAGHLTGLVALRYASRMIRLGYADTLLVGAVEEVSDAVSVGVQVTRGHRAAAPGGGVNPLGEGCVLFLLGGRGGAGGGTAAAELVDFEFGTAELDADTPALSAALDRTIRALLLRNALRPEDIALVSLAQSGDGTLDSAELAAVDQALGGPGVGRRIVAADRTGNSFSALGAFQLAAAMAVAATDRPAGDPVRPCLITSLGIDGSVGCALVRV
ncbi:MAG TPA: beta-ketoacyl synthase N-terminal-like domain-containing protein [Jatrophihabitans sp.]|uniref:beta-ketoacyl synthase N-terminal-like domain-containing protein n=1 Tax=Jatrophihabitans sp. TaxID=1932789 RepID=UPI002EEE256A